MEPIYALILIAAVIPFYVISSVWKQRSITKSVALNNLLISTLSVLLIMLALYIDLTCSNWGCLASIIPTLVAGFIVAFQIITLIIIFVLTAFKISSLNKLFRIGYIAFYIIFISFSVFYITNW